MRLLLVVNAFASSVTARNKVMIHQILAEGGHDVAVVETNRRGHATRYAHDAANRGVDVVVALGGDGTLNEVVTGLAGSGTAVAVLPGGSTNVFARTIGLPNDPVAAARVLAGALDTCSVRRIGLGSVNGRYFTFHTGVGYDAAVVAAVERRANVKRWFGHPLFVWASVTTWATGYDRRRPHFSVTVDDGPTLADGMFTIVMNTNPYTFLGERPLDLVPGAGLDSALAVVTFRRLTLTALAPALVRALRGGGLPVDKPHLDVQRDAHTVLVEHDEPFPYQVDGDYLGETRQLRFTHVPDAVDLVVPPPGSVAKRDVEGSRNATSTGV